MLGYAPIPPLGSPEADRPTHLPPPPLFETSKSFRTRLGSRIGTGRPPRVAPGW